MVHIIWYAALIGLSLFVYLLWKRNSAACLFYLEALTVVSTTSALPRTLLSTWKDPRNIRHSHPLLTFGAKVMGWTHSFQGVENVDNRRGIIVCNHQTTLDIVSLVSMSTVIDRLSFVIKKEFWYAFPFALYMYLCGCTFVDRGNPKSAYKGLEHNLTSFEKFKGTKYVFMAEGTRNFDIIKTRKMLPFRKGAFRLAIKYKLPITPMVHSPHHFYDKDRGYFGKGAVVLKFLPAIETKDLKEDDLEDLIQRVRDVMQKAFDELFEELCPNKS